MDQVAVAQSKIRFGKFLEERDIILEEINQFLRAVLIYCLELEDEYSYKADCIKSRSTPKICSLIESLCLIHALYGYPAESKTGENKHAIREMILKTINEKNKNKEDITFGVNKHAVREMILKTIKEKNKNKEDITFVRYCDKIEDAEFWKFKFSSGTSNLESQLREPAHIFLQMVREFFKFRKEASEVSRNVLEGLPDTNYLKPAVWAQHENKSQFYGVSLGVRPFLRPLYLYIKINDLRNERLDNGVKLEDVDALIGTMRKFMKPKPRDKSKYNTKILPCASCQIFFGGAIERENENFPPFVNCAEYDVIRTPNLDYVLGYYEEKDSWKQFKSACKEHFKGFNKLIRKLEPGDHPRTEMDTVELETYCDNSTSNPKVLQYQRDSETSYKLVARDWRCGKKMAKNRKTKRAKIKE